MSGLEEEHFNYAMQLVTSSTLPMVLLTAIKLKVLDAIAEAGPHDQLSAHEIASRLSISNKDAPNMLDRMLRVLASHSVVTCNQRYHKSKPIRVYGLAPVAKYFIPNEDGGSLGSLMELHQDKSSFDPWFKLEDAVLEGGTPFDKVRGAGDHEHSTLDNPNFNALYNKAMVDASVILMKEMLNSYHGFDNLKSLVDVGGGLGVTLNMIISKHPTIKGINLDMPQVIQHAPSYPGIHHVGGDMFQNIPQGDAIFMKWVLHGWRDDDCVKLLKKCFKAIPDDGKVIVVETILPVIPDTNSYAKAATNLDAIMMTQTLGGKERTKDEFQALAKAAGFSASAPIFKSWTQIGSASGAASSSNFSPSIANTHGSKNFTGSPLKERQRWRSTVKTSGKIRAAAVVAAQPAEEVKDFVLPSWADFDIGRAPVYWKTMNGLPPSSGERLKLFYNPAATKLAPNEEFGIAFNGGFNQPIMCGGEPRVMLRKDRGKADPPIYTIQICVPKHAVNLIFSFTNGIDWDGPYRLQFQVPKAWRNREMDFFNQGLAKELSKEGACEKAIFPDTSIVVDRCQLFGNLTLEGGDRCELNLVTGCTDPGSPEYNPLANVDDGSCPPYSDSED